MSVISTTDHHGQSLEVEPRLTIGERTIQLIGKPPRVAARGVPTLHDLQELLGFLESIAHRVVSRGVHHPNGRLLPDRPQMFQRQSESGA